MAGTGVSRPAAGPDPAAVVVVDAYLHVLSAGLTVPDRVKADVLAEVRDGLWAAVEAHRAHGVEAEPAAQAAVAEFGDPAVVARAFAPELAAVVAR